MKWLEYFFDCPTGAISVDIMNHILLVAGNYSGHFHDVSIGIRPDAAAVCIVVCTL